MNPGNGAAPCAAQRQGFKEIVQSSPAHLPTARTTETRNSGGQPNRTHPGAPTTSTRKTAPALGALGAGFFAECFPGQPRSRPSGPPQGTRHSAGDAAPGASRGGGAHSRSLPLSEAPRPPRGLQDPRWTPQPEGVVPPTPRRSERPEGSPAHPTRPAVGARRSRRDSLQLTQRLLPVSPLISAPVRTSTSAPSCHGFCFPPKFCI